MAATRTWSPPLRISSRSSWWTELWKRNRAVSRGLTRAGPAGRAQVRNAGTRAGRGCHRGPESRTCPPRGATQGRSPDPSRESGKLARGAPRRNAPGRAQHASIPASRGPDSQLSPFVTKTRRVQLTPDTGQVTTSVSGGAGPDPALSRELQQHTFILSQGCFLLGPVSWARRRRLLPLSSRSHPSVRACVLIPSSRKDASPMGSGPTRPTSFYLNPLFLKTPPPLTGPFSGPGRHGSENELGGGAQSSPFQAPCPQDRETKTASVHVSHFMLRR